MPKGYPRQNCVICDRHKSECGKLSKRGKCQDCARDRIYANMAELRQHSGPFFEEWRRRHAASVGGILVDDLIERSSS